MRNLSLEEIKKEKEFAQSQVTAIMNELENDYPGITEGVASFLGAGVGAGGSLAALSTLGVSGLSAAGITSGLAAAGSIVGGGMVAGIGVLAAPIAILGVAGYAIAKSHKNGRMAAALSTAISKLYSVQEKLMENAEYFQEEIAGIKATISLLKGKKPR